MRTTIVLARHGRTEWHHGNRYTGSDRPPDRRGRRTAGAAPQGVGGRLRAGRAVGVADAPGPADHHADRARRSAWSRRLDARLREVDFGSAEGKMLSELPPAVAEAFQLDPVARPLPGR